MLRKAYEMWATMCCRIYVRLVTLFFEDSWVAMMYMYTVEGTIFNWKNILASPIEGNVKHVMQVSREEQS